MYIRYVHTVTVSQVNFQVNLSQTVPEDSYTQKTVQLHSFVAGLHFCKYR